MATRNSQCPTDDCWAASPPQQDAAERLESAGVDERWIGVARRCSYCGCVYTREGASTIIRGYLDNEIIGQGWKPVVRRELSR